MNKERNIFYTERKTSRNDRQKLLNQQGLTIWLTGLSGSGKTTLASNLEELLIKSESLCYVLDGDNIRHGLSNDLDFSIKDRKENIRRIGEVCCLFSDAGLITIASFISPHESERQLARQLHQNKKIPFYEIFIDTPLDLCEKNDLKGLYKKARSGEIKKFTGISSPYEAPQNPDLILHPHIQNPEECCNKIIQMLLDSECFSSKS